MNTEDTAAQNKIIRGGVRIEKWDYELHEKVPQGSATLAGAEFTITNKSKQPVIVEGESYPVGDVIMTLVTDEEGVAFTKNNLLPYGEYEISETKAPVGYLPEGENLTQKFSIRENGKIVELNTEDTAAQNQVKRGDLQLIKVEDGTLNRMSHVKFTITSKTTGESHPFVTDENGYYSTSSSWNPHTQNTNRGESSEDGIWFGASQPDDEHMEQTVTLHKEKTVTITSKKPGTTISTSKPVKTGDTSKIALYIVLAVLAITGIMVSIRLKKRKKSDIKRLPCKKEK